MTIIRRSRLASSQIQDLREGTLDDTWRDHHDDASARHYEESQRHLAKYENSPTPRAVYYRAHVSADDLSRLHGIAHGSVGSSNHAALQRALTSYTAVHNKNLEAIAAHEAKDQRRETGGSNQK